MAAFKNTQVLFLSAFILLLVGVSMSQEHQQNPTTEFQSRLARGQQAMIDKGYEDMADMLNHIQSDLETLDLENKTYTVFAPTGASFWVTYESDPPLSIVRYHVVPFMVDKLFLESPSMFGQKVETLLKGHPLVVTTHQFPSLNEAFVYEWNIYNDGRLIVHGISQFFYPSYQTKYYPWFSETEAPSISPTATTSGSSYFGEYGSYKLASLMFLVPLVFFRFLLAGFVNLI